MEREASEGEKVEASDGFGQALVVAHETAKARSPGEIALGHSAPGQEHEATFGLGMLDDLGPEAVRFGGFGRFSSV